MFELPANETLSLQPGREENQPNVYLNMAAGLGQSRPKFA
jgi:hypothetical protein